MASPHVALFSLYPQGAPFIREARRFAAARGVPLTLILSGKPPRGGRTGWQSAKRRVRDGLTVMKLGGPRRTRICENVNAPDALRALRGAHGLIACYDQIFKAPAIDGFASLANIHPSILPFYRGPNPFYWCFANGERQTGYTLHTVTSRIDDGPILAQGLVAIADCADAAAVGAQVLTAAAGLVFPYLDHVVCGAPWAPQFIDGSSVYRVMLDYAPHPPAEAVQ